MSPAAYNVTAKKVAAFKLAKRFSKHEEILKLCCTKKITKNFQKANSVCMISPMAFY
jgi:hypothetical protein